MSEKPPLSPFRTAGSTVYVSGQLPRGTDGRIIAGNAREQVRQTLQNLQRVLANAGLCLSDVVKGLPTRNIWPISMQYIASTFMSPFQPVRQ